jgi:superfamily II DNA/RNA helicase
MVNLIIPDKWQQDAVTFLREGTDVVVQAPTGAGKTYIFELFYESLKGQAVYTVPTRALANDKLAEWRERGWDVGISTGDIAGNLGARVVVATLETQKGRFLRRNGPRLLVVDEYQLLQDPVRGMNYELILAMAPRETQILLLSGSVANPGEVVEWLRRIGRTVKLVAHDERPVRIEEVMLSDLPVRAPGLIRDYWTKLISRALQSNMGPILIFAPRRKAAEELAQMLSAVLERIDPLLISQEQALLVGEPLAKLLRNRVAYHHSGLSYGIRAGVIEPLAKRGQLRVVVATMGLAAGINFSMRSVLVTGTSYMVGKFQREVRPDELLQMFGRAGRRGLDEIGYALVTPAVPRLHDAYPLKLKRPEPIDWPSFLSVMQAAVLREEDPFLKAMELATRLFTTKKLTIGIEEFYETGDQPCGLRVDAERGRLVRRHQVEMKNSLGKWEVQPRASTVALKNLWIRSLENRWRPALAIVSTLGGIGFGSLCKIKVDDRRFQYGRELFLAGAAEEGWVPAKWLRRLIHRKHPLITLRRIIPAADFETHLLPLIAAEMKGEIVEVFRRNEQIIARFSFGERLGSGYLDSGGRWLSNPEVQKNYPFICDGCAYRPRCESMELQVTPAFAWRQLGLVDEKGYPTRRGIVFSFFNQGEGLAIAAALEHAEYRIEDLLFDLGNLRAGHRFAMDESPIGGRLGLVCQQTYRRADFPGYLEMGIPPAYGPGASEVIREVTEHKTPRHKLVNELLRTGDIERAITEWRSLLRQICHSPDFEWDRWMELKAGARHYVDSTKSPAQQPFPALLPTQLSKRIVTSLGSSQMTRDL